MWYDVGCERKRRIKDNSKALGLGNSESGDTKKEIGGSRENRLSSNY